MMRRLSLIAVLICAAAFGQSPPMPPIDTNLMQVGSVNLAWSPVSLAWHGAYEPMAYGVYWGTASNQLASAVIVSADDTNAVAPLFACGTNWLAVTSIDPLLQESDPSPAIAYNFVFVPPTNVVTVGLLCSTNLATWTYVQALFTLTNPPGNQFFKLSITNQIQTQ